MFIHRRPPCELPHLPPGEGCWLWDPAAVSLAVPLVTAILSSAGASWRCLLSCRGLLFGASMANHDGPERSTDCRRRGGSRCDRRPSPGDGEHGGHRTTRQDKCPVTAAERSISRLHCRPQRHPAV